MSKIYTQSIASLKTTTHDTFTLDAQQIMVYPGTGDRASRVNLIDTVNDAETKIANVSLVINDVSSTLSGVADDVTALETTISSLGDTYAPKSHVSDTSVHMSAADRENFTELVNTAPQFAKKTEANTFTETNTFSKAVIAQNGIIASGGDIVILNGTLTFEDLIDETVVERSGASGYQYVEGMPTSFENGSGDSNETYEEATFNGVMLNFGDGYNCKYTTADDSILTSNTEGLMLTINAEVPTELGGKLVCRYLVLDFRSLSEDTVLGVTWPEFPIRWLYGTPDIEAGYFYVLAFQRFTKDLIVGNVAVKLEK